MRIVRHFLEDPHGADLGASEIPGVSSLFPTTDSTIASTPVKANWFLGNRFLSFGGMPAGHRGAWGLDVANAASDRADCELMSSFERSTGTRPFLCARTSGNSGDRTGYFAELRFDNDTIAIRYENGGVGDTDLDTDSFTFDAAIYTMRFQVDGNDLKLRVWKEGDPEPSTWTLTTTDSAIAGPGLCGVGLHRFGGSPGGTGTYHYLSAATGGETAPARPKTWAEYLEWLGQESLRCVLVELQVLGQTSAGVANPSIVCMSNFDFEAKAEDALAHLPYEGIVLAAPSVSTQIPDDLVGHPQIGFGDLVIQNEISEAGGGGKLDAWRQWNWDGRPVVVFYGHPDWRRCDFRVMRRMTVEDIYVPGRARLGFKMRSDEVLMRRPVATELIGGSGPNASALQPFVFGAPFNTPPRLYDAPTLTYQVGGGGGSQHASHSGGHTVRDAGISLRQASRTILSVNSGTDVITFDAAHGLSVGGTVVFRNGTPPAPLSLDTQYFVQAVPSGTEVKLALTAGGGAIDLTTTTTGSLTFCYLYSFDEANQRFTLLSSPAGELSFEGSFAITAASALLNIYERVSEDNTVVARAPTPVGAGWSKFVADYELTQRMTGDLLDAIARSAGGFYTVSRMGDVLCSTVSVPTSGEVDELVEGDMIDFRPIRRMLPRDVQKVGYAKNFLIQTGGLAGGVTAANRDLYGKPHSLAVHSPSESGLDQPANHALRASPGDLETLLAAGDASAAEDLSEALYNLFRRPGERFAFTMDARAMSYDLGEVLLITHSLYGFENGERVVIVGMEDKPQAGTVEMEVWAPIDGAWPVTSVADPYVSEAYFQ